MGSFSSPEVGDDPISLRRALATGFALLAAIGLIVVTVLAYSSNRQRDEALAAQRHSFEVMILARTLESTITRSEAALGRYVVSGDQQTGRYYYDEWLRAGSLIERLQKVTRDNPRQGELIARLRQVYTQRGEQLAQTALRTNYGQGWNALARFYRAGQARSVEQMSDTLEQIIASERAVLSARTGTAARSVERSNWLASVLSAFAVIVVIGATILGFTTVQAITQRRLARRDIEDVARRAGELEAAVAERTAELRAANEALLAEAGEREAAEAKLRQVQKMEAVGQLTGGIAHDFNNMLAVVIGGLELAKRRIAQGDQDAERHLDNAMEGANRAATLTRRLLGFARAEPLLPEPVSPDSLLQGMTELLDRTLGERVVVKTRFASEDWSIWVDRHQLENAILNLAVNARDAMEGVGTLTLATGARAITEGEVPNVPPGEYVALAVSDTGCGMEQAVLERVFEPFFTTKPVGKGTGLGLSQIFGFVRQSQGEIMMTSEPGRGTTVTLLLPRFAGAATALPVEPKSIWPAATRPPIQHASILVVEDDPRVLSATAEALTELGHVPIPCPTPDQALGLLAANPDVRLILSDVVMPGTTGPELIALLRPLYPDVGVLFVTGYAGEIDEAAAFGGHDVLRKPFTIGSLASAVEAALAKSSGPHPFAATAAAA
jgi:signal transduction histidine kinase/CheY-like chemotaxis protein